MSLGVVTAEVIGDFDKRCGVIRLEARSQSLEGDVRGEQTVTEHADNVSEMLCTPCRAKGFLRRVFFVSTELVPLHQLEQTDTRQSPEAGSCCHFPQHRTTRAICSGNTL